VRGSPHGRRNRRDSRLYNQNYLNPSSVNCKFILLRPIVTTPVPCISKSTAEITEVNALRPPLLTDAHNSRTTPPPLLISRTLHEPSQLVRRKSCDSICDLANNSMSRGRPWHALQAQAFSMCQSADPGLREGAYRVFSGCPNLVMDLQTDAVLGVFQKGSQDADSVEVTNHI
jgi:hypothetical protein